MSFMDKMKKKAEELDLKNKAAHAATQARTKAGDLASQNRDKIDSVVDKASSTIDQRTEGKYADKIAKARAQVDKGVQKVAKGGTAAGAGGAAGAAGTSDLTGAAANNPLDDPPTGGYPTSAPTATPAAAGASDPLDPFAPAPDGVLDDRDGPTGMPETDPHGMPLPDQNPPNTPRSTGPSAL